MDDEVRLEGEEEMELDEASEGEDEDEETTGIPVSPANSDQLLGQTTPTTPGNITPDEAFHDPLRYQKFPLPGGKPLNIRRGPGRPRKERPLGITRGGANRRPFGRGGARGKGLGYARGIPRRTKSKDDDTHSESPSPLRTSGMDDPSIDGNGESGGNITDRSMPAPEEPPYFPEQWPGKACALCNLGERSQLGQGELLRLTCPPGFTPEKSTNRDETTTDRLIDITVAGDKSPRAAGPGVAVTCRRQKSLAKCRNTSLTNFTEPVEELTIVGYSEEPEVGALFEPLTGYYYVHQSCIIWSSNSQDLAPEVTCRAVLQASCRRCAYCSHFGAGIPCKVASCNRYFHFPCAAANSCFQDTKSLSLFCSQHLGQVPLLLNGEVTCVQCYGMGDVSNLVMCSVCGQHYHGSCVGLALLPGVRAGWQCASCRVCQVCRQPEDVSKVMLCERCDKAYHPGCLRPIVTSIPKYGWKCKCCRVCTDCGSRTPGAGLSSRWHSHYTVCDSCYQQRNKGFSCPLCRKAYRAAAYREMVQCYSCKKFVHGTCDSEADPLTYQQRKEAKPDYEYICLHCKNMAMVARRKDSFDEGDLNLSASQESLDGESSELDYQGGSSEEALYSVGLGKGKPFCATKIAKKRLGISGGILGRPKGIGKLGYQKRQKMTEFGRKRGPKAKMRGLFGLPEVGLQSPVLDSSASKEEEPGGENKLILCSAKDKFVLTQDICVMCGAIGIDSEGCLIACAQCGQCYHPYCASVKVTKVILQKGWRCLDCTVCEGCGERNDEARLILCDDCDISYHIYCIDPPLDHVPHGTWKCKWCAQCQTCGSNNPGVNSSWQKSYTQCGPCASHTACIVCQEAYQEGDLIIQCVQCERWLHCSCDSIKNEMEAERCAAEGYICLLCRPRDVPPPHLLSKPPPKFARLSPPPQNRSPEMFKSSSTQQYLLDGVYLSEAGMNHIKSLTAEHQQTRKKRRKLLPVVDKEADIMATIESVVAGGSLDNSLEENNKMELMDVKDEPETVLKEGMVWNQPPPEGFSICTSESGLPVLRRKRQRNLQKLGIGGFVVRLRGTRKDKEEEGDAEKSGESSMGVGMGDDKPRRKPQRRKPKTKLAECFPLYMQEAFFGKDLMDTTKEKDLESSSESEEERKTPGNANTIQLSQDELKAMEQIKAKQEKEDEKGQEQIKREEIVEDDGSDTEALGDILPISGDLLDSDLVNTIMNENDEDTLAKASEALVDELDDTQGGNKDELTEILSPHFNLEAMVRDTGLPNMDSKDIEEIFKGVLTDESQESQESSVFSVQAQTSHPSSSTTPLVSPSPHPGIQPAIPLARPQVPGSLPSVGQSALNSPISFPPPSPYHSEYSNSPQFSPAFSEPPSPWVNSEDEGNTTPGTATISYNQRNSPKMEADEALGSGATMSMVLYANLNHPEWKTEFPVWADRYKQITKKWRTLPNEIKAPYLNQARENRTASRMKKAQQEQDRLSNRDRSSREAEQERQWKQLQALRQHQAQMQQQVIIEQRVHGTSGIARVQRQMSEENTPQLSGDIASGLTTQLQVSTAQDTSQLTSLASPSPGSRSTFATPSLKAPRGLTPQSPHHQSMVRLPGAQTPCRGVRPGFPQPPSPFSPQAPQSPHDFPQSPASSQPSQEPHFQRQFEGNVGSTPASPYSSPQTPGTPRASVFNPPRPPVYAPPPPSPATSRTPDPYSQPPATPTSASPVSGYPSPRSSEPRTPQEQEVTFGQQGPEVNRQLRDLLQRQQFTKKIEGVGTGNWSQDGQNNTENNQHFEANHVPLQQHPQIPSNTSEGTFRHPLPPGIIRPRLPIQPNVLIRNSIGISPRHPVAANIQGSIDHRTKMLLQNRPQVPTNISQQHFQGTQNLQTRMPIVRNAIPEPYDILQQQQRQFTDANQAQNLNQRIARTTPDNLNQSIRMLNTVPVRAPLIPTTMSDTPGVATTSEASEIPDNVTAELEKLEQEGAGPMVEVEGVSAILGDLADDDDELLAEMGADFNILEYADPELGTITGGEKTNILDIDLEQVEVEPKDEKQKKETKDEDQKPEIAAPSAEIPTGDSCTTSTSLTLTENSNVPTITSTQATSQAIQVMQQQMHQHVQQQVAMGRPMPPGTRLLSPDGAVGVVTLTNTVNVSYPTNSSFPAHQQRISQTQVSQQQQRLGMRVAGVPNRLVAVHNMVGPRMSLAPPHAQPPPPYPGLPPPYPGPIQMGLCPGGGGSGRGMIRPPVHITGHQVPGPAMGSVVPHPHRRPLLLQQSCSQEQPLLLADLVQQEQRELQQQQEKQQLQQQQQQQTESAAGGSLLSDSDFERLRADVLGATSPPQNMVPVARPCVARQASSGSDTNWQQGAVAAAVTTDGTAKLTAQVGARQPIATQTPPESRVLTFNVQQLPAPPVPPENIVNEQDRQMQLQYEHWLSSQDQILKQQLHFYETEIQKLRKIRKSLNSKQRQLRKSGNELTEADSAELQRVTSEQSILQKHLDQARKQGRQHNMTIQEYQSKQQQRQAHSQSSEPCSPLMSPSQHSPMHSPAALVSQSPGPNMIQHSPATPSIVQHSPGTPLLQHSPGNSQSTNLGTMSPHNVQQQSPRIGTPHSQGDESPFSPGPMPSPGLCNPNTTRMTSPQHRAIIGGRLATSPGAFTPETRNPQQMMADQSVRVHNLAQRFVRPPEGVAQRRGGIVYSPQPGQQQLLSQQHQQLLQRQQIIQQQQQHENVAQDQGQGTIARGTLQRQQVFTQQQQHESISRQQILQQQQQQQQSDISQDGQNIVTQRNLQNMAQQRQILQQQQQSNDVSQEGHNVVAQRNLQMARQQIIQQQQQQQEGISQDGQNIIVQRSMQLTQQRQILQQTENVVQEGQNPISQRPLQMVPQQRQVLQQQQQQSDIISQEGQTVVTQRNLHLMQQRQQILQQQQIVQQHEVIPQGISPEGQSSIGQRTMQMAQQRQQILQQQQQQEDTSQDIQNVQAQRNLQIVQQRQILQQQQHEGIAQTISQDGQNVIQRTLQMTQQRQQILQQHENIPQDGQSVVTQRNLQMAQQRQQTLQQQQQTLQQQQQTLQQQQQTLQQQQQILQQQQQQIQQQHEDVSQDAQSTIAQRSLQMVQQRQIIQHETVSQIISQEGQNSIAQRSLQLAQQRQQILHQHEAISQEGQNITQKSLQMTQQRQQLLQQHEGVPQNIPQEGQNSIGQRSLQMVQQRQHMMQQQQRQFLQMQQQQQQKPPNSPMMSQPASSPSPQLHQQLQQGYGQPPSSPMVQQVTMGSPMLQQQLNPISQPPSPMNRISPMLHGGHHHSSTTNQPPSSPMMPRSPMVAGSPMQMQRRQSTGSSPAMPDRPQSVENPGTPRTPHTPHNFIQQSANLPTTSSDQMQILQDSSSLAENSRGGGNSNNSLNPIPFPNFGKSGYFKLGLRGGSPGYQERDFSLDTAKNNTAKNNSEDQNKCAKPKPFFGRFGYFKLGLRGGSPMWSSKAESSKSGKESEMSQAKREQPAEEKPNTSVNRKTVRIGSLVCADYNDFDDDSHTPPQASPTTLEVKPTGQNSSLISSTLDTEPLESPGVKLEQLADTTDYDDDKTIVNTEVTLSSVAQRDSDDITVIEQFGDSELVISDVISGSLEGDMQEEYILFEPEMVDLSTDSNDSLCHALVNDAGQGHDLVQILEIENPESQSAEEPILSDEDLIPSHLRNKKGLRLDIVRTLQAGKKLVAVTEDTPESPDQEELRVNPSPGSYLDQSLDQELMVSLVNESEVVIIDPTTKSPEDNLSKGSGDEDAEKIDSNLQTDVSKDNTANEGSIDDQSKLKQNKSPTNFIFSDNKPSHNKISTSTVHQTSISTITISTSAHTAISSSSNMILASISSDSQPSRLSVRPIAAEAKTMGPFDPKETPSSSFSSQKNFASIVEDAKIAAKLSQTAMASKPQQSKLDLKVGILSSVMPLITSSNLPTGKTESLSNPTKLVLSVQPTSVTLLTPKMSIPDLPKKEGNVKSKERQVEDQRAEMKEEEEVDGKMKNEGKSSESITEEKKTDPLNTTDELESMLEAIHNPAENAENKNDIPTTTLKRMSPVTDDLSLVNILENDSELVENDKEQMLSGSEAQKGAGKPKEAEKNVEEANNDKTTLSNEKANQKELCRSEVESSKPFLQHCLSEKKTLMEESSDEILDMLHNIIAPEMANSGELKSSSLIYQMPTPLDTLPLNILQDSLIEENLESDQLSLSEAKSQAKHQSSEMKKSPPATSGPASSSTLVVSTVAQLQKSTTTVPHLSPLSKPTELTSNVANVSHQLRTLLSSLQSNQNTVNQPGVVAMVSSEKPGNVSSASSILSTLNPLNVAQSGVSILARSDQGRPQPSTPNNIIKDSELAMKEALKDSSGMITAVAKISNGEQVFRVTSSATTIQSTTVSNLSSTTSAMITTRTITTSISISSNAMLNAMLSANPTLLTPSVAGHGRNNPVPTQSVNFVNSVVPSTSIQRSQNLQAILQVTSGCSTPARVQMNTNSTVTSSMQCVRTIVPPLATSSGVSGTPSILQTTLSQAPNHLLTLNQSQYKSPGLLPIDNKNTDPENQSTTSAKDPEESKVQEKREADPTKNASSLKLEESQNVLLKQLLQKTVCATTSGPQGPSLPLVPSLEAQLDRPVVPAAPPLLPQFLNDTSTSKPSAVNKQVLTRETSFLSHSVPHMKIQTSPVTKEEPPKPSPPISTSIPITSQRSHPESLKQQTAKLIPTSSGSSVVTSSASPSVKQSVSSSVPTGVSPDVSTNQQETPGKPGTSVDEELPTPQRVPGPVPKVSLPSQPLVTSGMTPKTVQPSISNTSSNVPGPQTPQPGGQQVQSQIQVSQKPIVVQQVPSSTPSVHPQSVQQVPQLSHGTIAGPPPATAVSVPAAAPSGSKIVPLVEVKKELGLEEVLTAAASATGATSHLQTDTKDFLTAKEELVDSAIDDKTDQKKMKRRQYQQKRKQSQGKDAMTAPQKKRSRKVSRLDEDYETFMENLMTQLRQLQPMVVLEPQLGRNYGVCPILGCGDLAKIGSQKDYNARVGDLIGSYGSASLAGISDHYNTQPFGELNPLSPQQPLSTQRGFYEQEFPPLKLDDSDDKKETMATNRDVDSPDTIVSSSSPECVIPEFMHHFPGLRLIEEESDEEADWLKRVSPVIPLISPIPIRLKPAYAKDATKQQDKENFGMPKLGRSPPIPLRENGNVTVTLTLNSQAADDIMGVLKDLANILNIAPPNGYQIVERTSTPPSQKLGLYRTKGKDGKEGAPVDIQSILNGAAKFCRHCDVVILNSLIRKKVSDLPFFSKEEAEPGDELCFCSAACYMQFALIHRTPSNTQDKAAAIVDHLCHKAETKLLDDDMKGLKKFPIKQQQQQRVERHGSMEIDNELTTEIKIKTEKLDNAEIAENEEKRPKKHTITDESSEIIESQPPAKIYKGVRYKTWSMGNIQPGTKFKKPTEREVTEMLFRMGVTVAPAKTEDSRRCIFCQNQGDATADGPARLLNFDVDKWVHLNCALWSNVVYEVQSGALMHLDDVLQNNLMQACIVCEKSAGTIKCYKPRCTNCYHLMCAIKDNCVFYKDKTMYCPQHVLKNEKDKELLTLSAYRRVYINRDENRQVAAVMHHSEHNHLLRVGSLIFLSVGQLLPHQLQNFHTPNYIYPVGYKIVRFYWSMRRPNKRCRYVCSIHDVSGRPEFRVLIQEPLQEDVELRDATPRAVWSRILEPLAELRRSTNSVQLFPRYVSGEDLFGLTEPTVVRVLESLPGIETLTDYRFKYGRNPLLELPLAINPTGSARTEARLRNQLPWKRPHTQRTGGFASRGVPFGLSTCSVAAAMGGGVSSTLVAATTAVGETASCPYSKQFVHSKSSQYKKMKQEWRNNVYLARSKIQGLGLYAARDLEKHTMVIEYIGEIIRTELAETREKQYEARNRGIYMFRLDEERVVDATLCGGLARYINHSCNPNCVAEIVEVERDLRIIIFAKRRISRGEELAYDYKFDIEDDQHKIACACGAPNCRKWMN